MTRFDAAPLLVIWEVTQVCGLACVHCLASAVPCRNAGELTTEEGFRLLGEVRSFGEPLMIFYRRRPPEASGYLRASFRECPAGHADNDNPKRDTIIDSGSDRVNPSHRRLPNGVSLDGAREISHDGFRGVHGSFHRTLGALREAGNLGLETQVNTTVTCRNVGQLGRISRILAENGAKLWSVFLFHHPLLDHFFVASPVSSSCLRAARSSSTIA